jgi:hypothetical protein
MKASYNITAILSAGAALTILLFLRLNLASITISIGDHAFSGCVIILAFDKL